MILYSHCGPHVYLRNVFKFGKISRSPRHNSGVPRSFLASTAHCSRSKNSSMVKKPINLGHLQAAEAGTPALATELEETGTESLGCQKGQLEPPKECSLAEEQRCPSPTPADQVRLHRPAFLHSNPRSPSYNKKFQIVNLRPPSTIPTPLLNEFFILFSSLL